MTAKGTQEKEGEREYREENEESEGEHSGNTQHGSREMTMPAGAEHKLQTRRFSEG